MYVTGTAAIPQRRCVAVELLNPSSPHVQYLRSRFGRRLCVSSKPAGGYPTAGVGCLPAEASTERIVVPDVVGLAPDEAARRIEKAKLRTCNASTAAPSRYAAANALRVIRQCPAAGAQVTLGAVVFTFSRGFLPGGFVIRQSADDGTPCE